MNRATLIIISLCSFLVGMLFLAIQQQWILFQSPGALTHAEKAINDQIVKKNATITILKNGSFYREQRFVFWPALIDEQIEQLVNAWLTLLDEETRDLKKVHLQAVCFTPRAKQAYISFDRCPFNKQWPLVKKWHLIESLFKTLKDNGIITTGIQLLVEHKPLADTHLDFSKPWPTDGFLKNKD